MSLEENDIQENTAHQYNKKRQEKQQRTVSQKPREEESGQHSQTRQDSSDTKTGNEPSRSAAEAKDGPRERSRRVGYQSGSRGAVSTTL